ncbi:flavodoxin family protein [Chloroflexota bacterium]
MKEMASVIVIYESKYGNTKAVAESIIEGIGEVSGAEAVLNELKEVDINQLVDFDMILIGSPNHVGGATRGIRKFIDELGKLELKGKQIAVFDTYLGGDYEKAVKKMEKQIGQKVSQLALVTPGLSIRVEGMKGPVTDGELPKCKDFGKKIAHRIKGEA